MQEVVGSNPISSTPSPGREMCSLRCDLAFIGPDHTPTSTQWEGAAVRRLFTAAQALEGGVSRDALRWGVKRGRWRRVDRGVYVVGAQEPTQLERAVGAV